MNDIKDIRENPDKYRKGLRDRGKDPTEIDELLRVDKGARIAKTWWQNLRSRENIDTELWMLYNVPRKKKPLTEAEKELQAAELYKRLEALKAEEPSLRLQLNEWQQEDSAIELALLTKEIGAADAKVEELTRQEHEMLGPYASVLEEIIEEIKAGDFFRQKGRNDSGF